ncbi:hypothetical protein BD779DRAFT_1504084 [Infundibulicybe gibba]|nr:hypothetical protein BD779DRAFT_1504084 [Infundibulicybe gibba]
MSSSSGELTGSSSSPPVPSKSPSLHSHSRHPYPSQQTKGRLLTSTKDFALKQLLHEATEQLRAERHRADEAERRAREMAVRLRGVNDARILAVKEATQAKEMIELYEIQLNAAQQEIYRAQDVIHVVDEKRVQAEEEAAKARTSERRLKQENMMRMAREEGRRIGIKEGLARGRDLGIHEGRLMGYVEARPSTRRESHPSPVEDSRPSRTRRVSSSVEIPPGSHPSPIPPVPPEVTNTRPPSQGTDIHPIIIHNEPPSPLHAPVVIPPDGFIPEIGRDSFIHLPPPHELSRPPLLQSRPLMIPANTIRRSRAHRHSSPESNSTTISQFDMVNDPPDRSPGSVAHTSPNAQSTQEHDLRRAPSWAGSQAQSTPAAQAGPMPPRSTENPRYNRSHSSTSSTVSSRAPAPRTRGTNSSSSTVPDVIVQPPSRTVSGASYEQSTVSRGEWLSPSDHPSHVPMPAEPIVPPPPAAPASNHENATPIILSSGRLPPGFMPMGYTPSAHSEQFLPPLTEFDHHDPMPGEYIDPHPPTPNNEPPVIPDRGLYGPGSDDDAVSSGISSSADTLTTPPARYQAMARANPTYTGSSLARAAGVPLPPSTVHGTPRSVAYSAGKSTSGRTPATVNRRLSPVSEG